MFNAEWHRTLNGIGVRYLEARIDVAVETISLGDGWTFVVFSGPVIKCSLTFDVISYLCWEDDG